MMRLISGPAKKFLDDGANDEQRDASGTGDGDAANTAPFGCRCETGFP